MATRTLHAPDGSVWEIWDVLPGLQVGPREGRAPLLPDEMSAGWLCFESPGEKRRLYPIPDGWDRSPDAELWRLCQGALPARPDRTPSF
ncbi:hypothetical protein [Longimicrobium sp.]|uniref:hypothetical protein n=1 Tax=Longimicrobium sp. TaxID=2029185 RepID=UPI002E37FD84|nr:hypothetical protein [Longimicrobium sp.]HEX6036775.1 hypothetical protein [Longimicrobium sp.]